MIWDLPPKIWTPPKPAIIRPADPVLIKANFLPGWGVMMPSAAAPLPPTTLTYVTAQNTASDNTTYNWSSVSIGAADATRYVIVATSSLGNLATVSSASIGGVSADIIVQASHSVNNDNCALIGALVPTGTTANINITWSASQIRSSIGVWRAIELASTMARDTNTSTSTSATLNVNVLAGGFVIGAFTSSSNPSFTWTGATERFNINPEGSTRTSGADASDLSAATPYALSCVSTGHAGPSVAASFR